MRARTWGEGTARARQSVAREAVVLLRACEASHFSSGQGWHACVQERRSRLPAGTGAVIPAKMLVSQLAGREHGHEEPSVKSGCKRPAAQGEGYQDKTGRCSCSSQSRRQSIRQSHVSRQSRHRPAGGQSARGARAAPAATAA